MMLNIAGCGNQRTVHTNTTGRMLKKLTKQTRTTAIPKQWSTMKAAACMIDFIVLLPGEIIRIPQESNLAWMTMFYALPRELVEGACPFLFFPGFFFQNRWTKRSSQSIIMMRKLTGSQLSVSAAPEGKYADYHNALVSFFRERWQHALVLVRHHPFGDRWAL